MKYCHNCGSEIIESAQFCGRCGAKQNDRDGHPRNAAVQPSAAAMRPPSQKQIADSKSGGKTLSVILGILLALTAIVTVVHGALYNSLTGINFKKIIRNEDIAGDLISDYVLAVDGYRIDRDELDEILDYLDDDIGDGLENLLNSSDFKNAIQKILNSGLDAILTGNPRKIMSQDDIMELAEKFLQNNKRNLGNWFDYNLDNNDIKYIENEIEYVLENYLYELGISGNPRSKEWAQLEEVIEDSWNYLGTVAKFGRFFASPTTKAWLIALDLLLTALMIFLNHRRFPQILSLVGIPIIVMGVTAIVMRMLVGVWVSIIVDVSILSKDVVRVLFSGYASTATSLAVWSLLIGVACIIVKKKLMSKFQPHNHAHAT